MVGFELADEEVDEQEEEGNGGEPVEDRGEGEAEGDAGVAEKGEFDGSWVAKGGAGESEVLEDAIEYEKYDGACG